MLAGYRPCCNNPTAFPDCNHGMAMLGLLELMASQEASVDEMFEAVKYVNAFWFPQQTVEVALLFKNVKGQDFVGADAREFVGPNFFSAGGFLIGLCTVPCSGAVYLAILSLLALQPTVWLGYSYLVLYNLVFILPLVIILLAASTRPTLNRLAHWNLHHKEWVRLALGSGVVVMGLLILVTV